MRQLITFILPTYNRKTLVQKAIASVEHQKWQEHYDWELIVIDDGSTDGTSEVLREIVSKNPRIKLISQKNSWVGSARNRWLEIMSPESDYTVLVDSDDELLPDCVDFFLGKIKTEDPHVMWWYYLCEDQDHRIIGDKKILRGKSQRDFTYEEFLKWEINVEMGIMVRSSIFRDEPKLRFPEDIITETVMWSKMWQYFEKHWYMIRLYDYVGRLYRTEHTEASRITKTISPDRFRKNAIWNERVIETIGDDLEKRGYHASYADLLFRVGINSILSEEVRRGRSFLKKSLEKKKDLKLYIIWLLSFLPKKILLILYKIYIHES